MNTEEYISSGILELYVLGQLTAEENAEVENIANTYPAVKKEIGLIEQSLEAYAKGHSKAPRKEIKDKILSQLNDSARIDPEINTLNADKPSSIDNSENSFVVYKKRAFSTYLVAASWILTIFFAATTMFFWSKWRSAEQNYVVLQSQSAEYSSNYNRVKNNYETEIEDLHSYIALLNDESTRTVTLSGLPIAPSSEAKVLWNENNKKLYVSQLNLPPPPSGKQYQLWAIYGDQKIDAGVLSKNGFEIQKMKDISSAQAFAITLEKEGGSPTPNLDAIYAMGKI
ncbi:MAG TPA: anti-sigma factor [Cytophagales bacterium]|nr:anti-sigma factor [Cytophagales bacterium]